MGVLVIPCHEGPVVYVEGDMEAPRWKHRALKIACGEEQESE